MTEQATTQRDPSTEPDETVEPERGVGPGTSTPASGTATGDRPLSTDDIAASSADRSDAPRSETPHPEAQRSDTPPAEGQPNTSKPGNGEAALFDEGTAKDLQARWQSLQVEFVDEPRGTVEKADALVAEVMKQLAESFARERRDLEAAWSGGREASTEDLRQAIRRYRSFFNRLLSI